VCTAYVDAIKNYYWLSLPNNFTLRTVANHLRNGWTLGQVLGHYTGLSLAGVQIAMSPEPRRPLGSNYHINWYQTLDTWTVPGSPDLPLAPGLRGAPTSIGGVADREQDVLQLPGKVNEGSMYWFARTKEHLVIDEDPDVISDVVSTINDRLPGL